MGFSPKKTFLSVNLKPNQQDDSVTVLRSYYQKESPEILNLFQSI